MANETDFVTDSPLIEDGVFTDWDGCKYLLPRRWTLCPECEGEGKTANPAFDGMPLCELDRSDREAFIHNYKSGVYDITCASCNGRTTVRGYSLAVLPKQQRDQYREMMDQYYIDRAQDRAERRATGCWYD